MSNASKRPTVMVVDDTQLNLSLMENILRGEYDLQLADSGAKALEMVKTSAPDLILLDVMMPEMDGFEVCRRLKSDAATANIPVLFVTAKNEVKDEELGFELGASDFIHKPVSAPVVAARVKAHLKIKFMQDYLQKEIDRLHQHAEQSSAEMEHLKNFMWAPGLTRR